MQLSQDSVKKLLIDGSFALTSRDDIEIKYPAPVRVECLLLIEDFRGMAQSVVVDQVKKLYMSTSELVLNDERKFKLSELSDINVL